MQKFTTISNFKNDCQVKSKFTRNKVLVDVIFLCGVSFYCKGFWQFLWYISPLNSLSDHFCSHSYGKYLSNGREFKATTWRNASYFLRLNLQKNKQIQNLSKSVYMSEAFYMAFLENKTDFQGNLTCNI